MVATVYFFTKNVYDNSSYHQYLGVCIVASHSLVCLSFMPGDVEQSFWCLLPIHMHSFVKSPNYFLHLKIEVLLIMYLDKLFYLGKNSLLANLLLCGLHFFF